MEPTHLVLDRDEVLAQLVSFLRLSFECMIAPAKVGGTSSRMGQIPRALRDSPANAGGHETVFLSDAEAEAYNDVRHHLGLLRETEWLSTEDLDAVLWQLACEIALTPDAFRDEANRLVRAQRLLADVLHELERYEVVFRVEHVSPPPHSVPVWDATLLTASEAVLAPFVAHDRAEYRDQTLSPFLGHAALIVTTEGTAPDPVIERARHVASHRLHVLRASLASHWQTHPEQLLYSLGCHALARVMGTPPRGLLKWSRPPATPIDLEIHAGHHDRLTEMQAVWAALTCCHPSIRSPVERSQEWIGRGLCRHWPGDALRDYTTALEVLLVSSDKEQKSVLLPYRMLALAELHGKSMIHPTAIRHAYDRRSLVIHEGIDAAGDDHATRVMLAAARDCVGWLTSFASAQPGEDHATLLDALDTPSLRAKAVGWLSRLSDPWSTKLVAGIQSLPQ